MNGSCGAETRVAAVAAAQPADIACGIMTVVDEPEGRADEWGCRRVR